MGTAPAGFQTPKTDWTWRDAPNDADLRRWEGNENATETGERTVDPTQAPPTTNKGSLRNLLDWLTNRIAAIVGDNWYAAPAATLKSLNTDKIGRGTGNQNVEQVKSIMLGTDTRTAVLTYTSGKLTKVEDKDGSTIVRTTTLNYTNNQLSSVVETAGGKTITTTLNYNPDGTLASAPKAVS